MILTDGQSDFLFKFYMGEGEGIVQASEVVAADILQLLDPERSLPVAEFAFEGLSGTIQPYLSSARIIRPSKACVNSSLIVSILRRQVLDWVLSNHDEHINHVLLSSNSLVFVDYGQAYKYFPNDVLSASYHPNRLSGQLEPIYNLIYRHAVLTIDQQDDIISLAAQVSRSFDNPMWELLRPLAIKKFASRNEQDRFVEGVRNRVRDAESAFTFFLRGMDTIDAI